MMALPPLLWGYADRLIQKGYQVVVVGGAVRDFLLGHLVQDYDLATNASPTILKTLFPEAKQFQPLYGTMVLTASIQLSSFRKESHYTDYRHPDFVSFDATLSQDLARRDFTVNAIAYDLLSHKMVDLFQGKEDIAKKILRCVGDPDLKFSQDTLRIFRLCRFVSQLSFCVEDQTALSALRHAGQLLLPSPQSIQKELMALLSTQWPSQGLFLLHQWGLLERLGPAWSMLTPRVFDGLNDLSPKKRWQLLINVAGVSLLKNFPKAFIKQVIE